MQARYAAIVLLTALATPGCSNSRSGSASGSTSAGSTAPAAPPAPASQGIAIDAFNAEIEQVWNRIRPDLEGLISDLAKTHIAQTLYASGAVQVEVVNVRTVQSNIDQAPGFLLFRDDKLVLRTPRQGSWQLVLDADIRVRFQIFGGFAPAINVPLQVRIEDLSLEVEADFDHSDPTRPILARAAPPRVQYRVVIDSPSPIVQNLTQVLNPLADTLAQVALTVVLGQLTPTLNSLQGLPGPVPAAGAPPLTDSGIATPFAEIVGNVERKIRRDNLPHGTLLHAIMDTPATDSWDTAYLNGGSGNPGTALRYMGEMDSAHFTGEYLGAQAFRYAATRDPDVLGTITRLLDGIGKLLEVNGNTGLLARCAAPVSSLVAPAIGTPYATTQIGGQTWIGMQGPHGISRDQYSGVFYGLSLAYDLVDDPAIKAECAYRIRMMLDYLIANEWIIDEDRGPLSLTNGSRAPTFWFGVGYQKLAFLHMGYRIAPTAYGAALAQAGPLSSLQWLSAWSGTLGNDHYYKFDLSHIGYFNFFRLETDQQRWLDLNRAYRITRRFVGHHRNPHFDLIDVSIDPSSQAVFHPQVREVMRTFLQRNHRQVAPPVIDLSGVNFVPVTSTSYANGQGSLFSVQTQTVMLPDEPLDVRLRRVTGHTLWQRDPFTPALPNEGNPRKEKTGLDAVGPYWMGVYQGAF